MEHEGVKTFGTHRRSTSAGDVVALEDGGLYRCEMDGWTRIGTTWVGRTQEEAGRGVVPAPSIREDQPVRVSSP